MGGFGTAIIEKKAWMDVGFVLDFRSLCFQDEF